MPMFTELPCGVSLNNYLSALGHSREGALHLTGYEQMDSRGYIIVSGFRLVNRGK